MGRMGCASSLVWRPAFLGSQTVMVGKDVASWIAIGAALISACAGLYAIAESGLRDKVEKFVPMIREQSPWAAWATIAAAVSVVAQAVEKLPV
jgi:hypothetical protein